ncbi:uncharacterized protein BDW47DRAFT_113666 [Aspergillus candidus]|uniref:Uncharacterized protein n=1 Tax=Aspergillus candidus TaxID=41067 RepID=A0A2I2EYZ3_ASPCN|nr:hypothetical protein BDW47DRAFT_113666 [Aspergillus candidus]PLB33601.1 hypothetical protein BDW47DRAFT_113666 [Aspergillus candidus]
MGYLAVLHGWAKQTRISAARTCIWTTPSSPPTPGNDRGSIVEALAESTRYCEATTPESSTNLPAANMRLISELSPGEATPFVGFGRVLPGKSYCR